MSYEDIANLNKAIEPGTGGHIQHHVELVNGLQFLAEEVEGSEPNVEIAYAELNSNAQIPAAWADIEGLAITFATTDRPAMVSVYLGIAQGSGGAGFKSTFQFEVYRTSDNKGLADTIANISESDPYQPIPMLQFRVPAGKASDTYKVRATRLTGDANGVLNFTEKTIFINAGRV